MCKVNGTEVTAISSLKVISNPTPTPTPTFTTYTTPGPNGSSSLAGTIAGAVFGAILCIALFVILIFLLYYLCWQNRTAFISKNAPSGRSHIDSFEKCPYSPRDGAIGTRGQVCTGDTVGVEVLTTTNLDYLPSVDVELAETNLALKVTEDIDNAEHIYSEVDEPNLSENPSYSCHNPYQFSENPAYAVI